MKRRKNFYIKNVKILLLLNQLDYTDMLNLCKNLLCLLYVYANKIIHMQYNFNYHLYKKINLVLLP